MSCPLGGREPCGKLQFSSWLAKVVQWKLSESISTNARRNIFYVKSFRIERIILFLAFRMRSSSIFWFEKELPFINYPIEPVNWPWNCSLIFSASLFSSFQLIQTFDCSIIMIGLSFLWHLSSGGKSISTHESQVELCYCFWRKQNFRDWWKGEKFKFVCKFKLVNKFEIVPKIANSFQTAKLWNSFNTLSTFSFSVKVLKPFWWHFKTWFTGLSEEPHSNNNCIWIINSKLKKLNR